MDITPVKIPGGTGRNLAMLCLGEPDENTLPVFVINGATVTPGQVGDRLAAVDADGNSLFCMEFYGRLAFDWILGPRTSLTGVDTETDGSFTVQILPRLSDEDFEGVRVVTRAEARAEDGTPRGRSVPDISTLKSLASLLASAEPSGSTEWDLAHSAGLADAGEQLAKVLDAA